MTKKTMLFLFLLLVSIAAYIKDFNVGGFRWSEVHFRPFFQMWMSLINLILCLLIIVTACIIYRDRKDKSKILKLLSLSLSSFGIAVIIMGIHNSYCRTCGDVGFCGMAHTYANSISILAIYVSLVAYIIASLSSETINDRAYSYKFRVINKIYYPLLVVACLIMLVVFVSVLYMHLPQPMPYEVGRLNLQCLVFLSISFLSLSAFIEFYGLYKKHKNKVFMGVGLQFLITGLAQIIPAFHIATCYWCDVEECSEFFSLGGIFILISMYILWSLYGSILRSELCDNNGNIKKEHATLQHEFMKNSVLLSVAPVVLLLLLLGLSTWKMIKKHAEYDLQNKAYLLRSAYVVSKQYAGTLRSKDFMRRLISDLVRAWPIEIVMVDKEGKIVASNSGYLDRVVRRYNYSLQKKIYSISLKLRRAEIVNLGNNLWVYPIERISNDKSDNTNNYLGAIVLRYDLDRSGAIYILKHLFFFWIVLSLIIAIVTLIHALRFSYNNILLQLEELERRAKAVFSADWLYKKVDTVEYYEFRIVAKAFDDMIGRLLHVQKQISELFVYIRTILDTIGCMVIVVDNNGVIRSVNKRACEILGYKKVELVGSNIVSLSEGLGVAIKGLDQRDGDSVASKSHLTAVEFDLMSATSEKIPCLVSITPILFRNMSLIVTAAQDLRNLLTLQRGIETERNRLLITLKSIGEGVIVTDTDANITLVNKVAEVMLGWKEKDIIGKPISLVFEIIDRQTNLTTDNIIEKVIESKKSLSIEENLVLISKKGSEKFISLTCSPILDDTLNVSGVILVFRDITQDKLLQDEIIKAQKLESLAVLAGGIAHDFNNMLTGILGNIELALMSMEEGLLEEVVKYLNLAEQAIMRASNLTRQLLTFAKGGEPIKELASLKELIVDSTNFVLSGSNIKCYFSFQDDLWMIRADKGQISQVIQNLVINAQQAMPGGGSIYISCRNIDEDKARQLLLRPITRYVEIEIKDTGLGISKEYIDRIFEPFFTTKEKGSGLGLSICYSIIKKHDGHLMVDSEIGRGTVFYIYLPASQEGEKNIIELDSDIVIKPIENKVKILVMDDDPSIRETLEEFLHKLGYIVVAVEDGSLAIEAYKKSMEEGKLFDVVILDLTVPGGLGGKEVIKEILDLNPEAKVIVSTGYSSDPIMGSYLDYGFKGYLKKPFSLKELSMTIRKVLEQ